MIDPALDDILIRWHNWKPPMRLGRGHNRAALVVGDYQVSRQYDDTNGALYSDEEAATMEIVTHHIHELPPLMRYSIQDDARSLTLGIAVFHNPRLPHSANERAALLSMARIRLRARLVEAGVME